MSEVRGQVQTRAVTGDEAGLRLDRWFQRHFPELSHGALQKLLRTGQVRLDGKRAEGAGTGSSPPRPSACRPASHTSPPAKSRNGRRSPDRDAAKSSQLVIHRDAEVIAINKPPGLAVQGGSGTERHVDGMLDALRFGYDERPRLVHRLDKDTSGLLLLARTGQAAKRLAGSFRDRETEKLYWAVVVGVPPRPEGAIDLPLAKRPGARDRETMQVDHEEGQKALTHFRELDRAGKRAALLALWPRTGRTHQLRALRRDRLPHPGRPQVWRRGAAVGGRRCAPPSPCAAHRLAASLGQRQLKVQAELPPHFRRTVEAFGFSTTGD
jgi:23S rRNA pseudouridine955/2504/2580 synthase